MILPSIHKHISYLDHMLTLDQSTVFYWTLSGSDLGTKKRYAINEWAATIPNNAKSGSQAPSHTTAIHKYNSHPGSAIPSLTSGTSHGTSHLTIPSVLTSNIKVISHPPLMLVKVKAEPATDATEFDSNGGLSDNDKMKGI